jgi:uncharacterized protein (TIRG00374 family)
VPVVVRPGSRAAISRGTLLKLTITLAVSAYVLAQFGVADALQTLRDTQWRIVALAGASALLAMVLNVKRWQMMLQGQGANAPLPGLIRLYLIGMFVNNILPSRLGGDVIRAYGTSIRATTKTRSVAAVLMDRLVGATSVLLLGVIAFLANPSVIPDRLVDLLVVGLVVSVAALAVLLYRGSRFGGIRERLLRLTSFSVFGINVRAKVGAGIDAARSYSRARGLIGRALAVSMVANGLSIVNLFLYSQAVGAGLSLSEVAVVAPVVLAIGLLPLSINGIGTIELTFVMLFGAMGVEPHVALAVALLRRFVLLAISLFGGLLYALRRFA